MNKEKSWNNELNGNNEINGKHEVNDPMSPWPHASMPQLNERVVHWNCKIWNKQLNKVNNLNTFVEKLMFTFEKDKIDK